jgi:glycosyltransferase involved in cell wall biosynthesis
LGRFGGVTSVALGIADSLRESPDFDPTLINIADSFRDPNSRRLFSPQTWNRKSLVSHDPNEHVENWGVNAVEFEAFRYWPWKQITERLNQFDLVQIVSGSLALAFIAKKSDTPVFAHVATKLSWERSSQLQSMRALERITRVGILKVVSMQERLASRKIDYIMTMNPQLFDHLTQESNVSLGKIALSPPGIDTDRFRPLSQKIEGASPYFLYIGRLDDQRKGLNRLLLAYQIIRNQIHDAPNLILAGPGKLPEELAQFIQINCLSSHVKTLSSVPEIELPQLIAGATMFLQCSYQEGLGLAVLEAQSCGIPVVATRTDGTLQTIEHGVTGYLVNQGSDIDVASRIATQVLHHLSCGSDRMGSLARESVEKKFSARKNYSVFPQMYRKILEPM